METYGFIQIFPQGRLLTSVPVEVSVKQKWKRSLVKPELQKRFCVNDDDSLVWFEWDGGKQLKIEIDWPKDRFSMNFLRKKAKELGKLMKHLNLISKVEICEMHRDMPQYH